MKWPEIVVIIIALLVFFIPKSYFKEERQEEVINAYETNGPETYHIVYKVKTPKDESIADIIWLKRAAQKALESGIPYFNVTNQKRTLRYNKKFQKKLSIIEGTIILDNDPMTTDYDANEIESLPLF